MTGKILRLYPPPTREITTGGVYEDLELPPPERRDPSRPYVIINMVSSVDGRIAVEGKSSRIGSETDRRTMRTLRSKADAVMIGAGTLRAEKLSLGLDEPSGEQPLAVIATRTGDVPLESNLIVGERQEVLIVTTQDAPENLNDQLCESARVLRVPATPSGAINLPEALEVLKAEHAVEVLLVEGGPSLNHALISQNLADELFLTLAPKLLGGTSDKPLTILGGPALAPIVEVKLLSAHLADSELFVRCALL
ncbi:MAG: RibD family protein [Actinomycetota bacterium]|nr:RibD family protein [Actinomycetota bacterium]